MEITLLLAFVNLTPQGLWKSTSLSRELFHYEYLSRHERTVQSIIHSQANTITKVRKILVTLFTLCNSVCLCAHICKYVYTHG